VVKLGWTLHAGADADPANPPPRLVIPLLNGQSHDDPSGG
jgi:hypothetical protein